jgi:hypothetical protein
LRPEDSRATAPFRAAKLKRSFSVTTIFKNFKSFVPIHIGDKTGKTPTPVFGDEMVMLLAGAACDLYEKHSQR